MLLNSIIQKPRAATYLGTALLLHVGATLTQASAGAGQEASLLVCGWSSSNVIRYSADDGSFLQTLVSTGGGGLQSAHSLLLSPTGTLLVSSFGNDRVIQYNIEDGTWLGNFVAPGAGGLNGPSNAIFGPDGNLYVTSFFTNDVPRYDGRTGAAMGDFVLPGAGGLSNPESHCCSCADGPAAM